MTWSPYHRNEKISIDLSEEILAIGVFTALKFSLKNCRKHILQSKRLCGDQALSYNPYRWLPSGMYLHVSLILRHRTFVNRISRFRHTENRLIAKELTQNPFTISRDLLAICDKNYKVSFSHSRNCRNYRSSQVGSGLKWKKFEPALTINLFSVCLNLLTIVDNYNLWKPGFCKPGYRNYSDSFWSRRKNYDRLGCLRCNYFTQFHNDLYPKELHDGGKEDKRLCSWSIWNIGNLRACSHDPGTTHCPGATHWPRGQLCLGRRSEACNCSHEFFITPGQLRDASYPLYNTG